MTHHDGLVSRGFHPRHLDAPPDVHATDKTVHLDYDMYDARQYQVDFHFALTDLFGTYTNDGHHHSHLA